MNRSHPSAVPDPGMPDPKTTATGMSPDSPDLSRGITLDSLSALLRAAGSEPLPDPERLARIAREIPGQTELLASWMDLFSTLDQARFLENPGETLRSCGIDLQAVRAYTADYGRRLTAEGIRFPEPDAIAALVLSVAQHLMNEHLEPTSMPELDDIIQRNEAIIARNEALLRQTDQLFEERDRLLDQYGLTVEAVQRFIESDRIQPEDRAYILQEVAKMEQQFLEDLPSETVGTPTENRTKKTRMKQMI